LNVARWVKRAGIGFLTLWLAWPVAGHAGTAGTVTVAVASSFYPQARARALGFERERHARVRWVVGSSGRLFWQIRRGAPFDLFISADARLARRLHRPVRRIARGCVGLRLGDEVAADVREALAARPGRIAIPDPRVAPMGAAARDALRRMGAWEALRPRLVHARNALQARLMVEHGLVAGGLVPVGCDGPHLAEVRYTLVKLSDAPAVAALGARLAEDAR